MAFISFPEPKDLELPINDVILDGRPKNFQKWDVSNPHPGYGKDPNILNEYGHTKYPMWVGNVIVNNEDEEKAERTKIEQPATSEGWNTSPPELKQDGPTVAEWIAAGYKAVNYPPSGYASKSTEEEIKAAITSEAEAPKGWT